MIFDQTGQHVIADLFGCDDSLLNDPVAIRRALEHAAAAARATVIRIEHHAFSPQGVTAFALLAESHIAIHTWPDKGYAAADIFTCGSTTRPLDAAASLRESLAAESHAVRTLRRGETPRPSSLTMG